MRPIVRALRKTHARPRHTIPPLISRPRARLLTSVEDEFRKNTKYKFTIRPQDRLRKVARRIFNFGLFYLAAGVIAGALGVEKVTVERKDKDAEEEEEEEDDEIAIPDTQPDDASFFALEPPKEIKREGHDRLFPLDDPDYKAIAALGQDREGLTEIRRTVTREVLQSLSKHKEFRKALGGKLRCTRRWIDILPEGRIPAEYQRWGFEYNPEGDGAMYAVSRPLDALEAGKVLNILYPTSLVNSTWHFFKTLYALKVPKIKAAYEARVRSAQQKQLEAELAKPSNLPQDLSIGVSQDATISAVKRIEREKNASLPKPSDVTSISLPNVAAPRPQQKATPPTQKTKPVDPPEPKPEPDAESKTVLSRFLAYPLNLRPYGFLTPWFHGSDISKATFAALGKLMYDAHMRDVVPVRGDVLVKGLIEVSGTKGMAQISVNGYVDSRTRKTRIRMTTELLRTSVPAE